MRVTSDPASIANQNWDHSFERFTVNSGSRTSFPFYILTFSHFHVSTENQLRPWFLLMKTCIAIARTLQMNSDWFPKISDYFLTTFRWNFPHFSDQSWQKFLLWVTEYCQRHINTHRSLWILIINWNHLLFSAAALIIQLIDWSWWQHRVKNSNTQSKYGDIIHYHVDKFQNFY